MSIRSFFARFRYRHIATVEGRTEYTYRGKPAGTDVGLWALKENGFGHRRILKIGNAGESAAARYKRNEVKLWKQGGPLPVSANVEEPRKKAKLLVFQGGAS